VRYGRGSEPKIRRASSPRLDIGGLATEGELRDQVERDRRRRRVVALRALLDLPGGPKRTRPRSGGFCGCCAPTASLASRPTAQIQGFGVERFAETLAELARRG
jgi:hypothetical protein